MKAFEEQWLTLIIKKAGSCAVDNNICSAVTSCAECKEIQKAGYREALEHIMRDIENGDITGTNDGSWAQQSCRENIVKHIEEELDG